MGEKELMSVQNLLSRIYGIADDALKHKSGGSFAQTLNRIRQIASGGEVKPRPLEEAEVSAQRVGRLVSASLPVGWWFTLILGTFGEDGRMTYMSSARREDTISMLRELAEKLESGEATL